VFTIDRKQQETITTVKRNVNDKLQVSNGEIHFTRECVNLVARVHVRYKRKLHHERVIDVLVCWFMIV